MPPKSSPATIREAVRAAAEQRGLTAGKLSRAAEELAGRHVVSEEQLRLFLRGDSPLSSDRLDVLFRVLGISVAHSAA